MKFLAIDIGNTSIHFALHTKKRWSKHFFVSTKAKKGEIKRLLFKEKASWRNAEIAIASVVPEKTETLLKIFKKIGARPRVIGKNVRVPIQNRYSNPSQVGVDRLLGAFAAWKRVKKELIVIDFGTAITFDVVSAKGEYLGGVIAPGIEISLEALFKKTALLPKIRLAHPKNWIGKDTVESIRVGCSVGIGGLCDRTVEAISKKYGMKPVVLATGGYAHFMKRYCRSVKAVVPDLILEGILETCQPKRPLTKKS